MAILLYEFQDFPDEQEAIGKMLIHMARSNSYFIDIGAIS